MKIRHGWGRKAWHWMKKSANWKRSQHDSGRRKPSCASQSWQRGSARNKKKPCRGRWLQQQQQRRRHKPQPRPLKRLRKARKCPRNGTYRGRLRQRNARTLQQNLPNSRGYASRRIQSHSKRQRQRRPLREPFLTVANQFTMSLTMLLKN